MIKILIVEDEAMLKDSLVYVLDKQEGMKVVGAIDDASQAPQFCREQKPDLILMDVITKETNGIVFAAQIRKEMPQIKIVIMTAFPEITFVDEARKAGAHSFIYKSSGNEHLFYVIRSTMRGISYYPGPVNNPPSVDQLTEREIAVVRFIHQGVPRSEMIKDLGISEMTLKKDINSILNKTGFDSIMEFAVYAAVNNLILPVSH
jgi:DNA-binding NarL/FixJ family response regulator